MGYDSPMFWLAIFIAAAIAMAVLWKRMTAFEASTEAVDPAVPAPNSSDLRSHADE
jgi:hypothetical protein